MFEKLFDLSHKRDWQGAFGFYIFYLFAFSIIMACAFVGFRSFTGEMTLEKMSLFGKIISSTVAVIFMFLLLGAKKMHKDAIYFLLIAGSFVVAYFGGLLFGLIPIAYATTMKQ